MPSSALAFCSNNGFVRRSKLLPFQREFLKAVENPKYDTVAISGPRTLGKTFIAAQVLIRCMTPGDALHQSGKEYILGAATLEQARLTYSFIREALEPTGEYRWLDSSTRLGATHEASNTKLRAISSNAKSSFGLVTCRLSYWTNLARLRLLAARCSPTLYSRPRAR